VNLTDLSIKALKPPDKGQKLYTDDNLKGFGVRVSQGGTKTFILVHGNQRSKTTIGRVGLISLAEARAKARHILAEKTLGKHTIPPKSFESLKIEFLGASKLRLKERTVKDYTRLLARFRGFGDITKITARDITAELRPFLKTPGEANHLLVALKALFTFAVQRHYLTANPALSIPLPSKATPRTRVLTDDELVKIWRACGDDTFGRTVKLLILTGQRRSEVQHWKVDGDTATLPAAHSKNNTEHVFPLPAMALEFLDRPLTFNGWSKAKTRLDKTAGVTDWTLHDLRRTYSTIHAKIATPIHVTERLLNHLTGTISGVSAVYNRHTYAPEMRQAVDNYEAYIQSLLARA